MFSCIKFFWKLTCKDEPIEVDVPFAKFFETFVKVVKPLVLVWDHHHTWQ